jgi:selenocysteine lyase/cysteine desulfurase
VSRFAESARRFATGTPQVLPALLSRVGLSLLESVGIETIRALSLRRTARILARADDAGIEVRTPRAAAQRGGVVSLRFPGDKQVAAELVRQRFVCSHRGALRIAPHFYNTDEEVDLFMDALDRVRRSVA